MVIGLIKFWSTIKAIWLDPEAAVSNENLSAWNFISLLALLTNVSPAAWEILRVLLARPKESPVIAPAVSANVDVLPTVSTWFKLPTLLLTVSFIHFVPLYFNIWSWWNT